MTQSLHSTKSPSVRGGRAMTLPFSSELAPDEGRVFVAYAPPYPVLVMGRRDPRNSELCVSQFYWKPPEAPWPDPNDPSGPRYEHITGPEAEHLLAAALAALHQYQEGGRRR